MAASLNDIYRSVGELTGIVKGLADKIEENERRAAESVRRADESRANVHRRLDDQVMRLTHMESDVTSLKNKVEGMEKVTVQTTTLITKAEGAGTLGRWLVRVGIGVVTAAGWLIGVYTWITGRPPP